MLLLKRCREREVGRVDDYLVEERSLGKLCQGCLLQRGRLDWQTGFVRGVEGGGWRVEWPNGIWINYLPK